MQSLIRNRLETGIKSSFFNVIFEQDTTNCDLRNFFLFVICIRIQKLKFKKYKPLRFQTNV